MRLEQFEASHMGVCLDMLEARYCRERESVPALPPYEDYLPVLNARYRSLAESGRGRVLVEAGRVRGMMAAFPVPMFFGGNDGVFVPAWANLHDGNGERGLLTELYSACATEWVREGRTSHVLNFFAHDGAVLDGAFRLGFGMRCVDAVRAAARIVTEAPTAQVKAVHKEEVGLLAELHRQHNLYYREPPMFMPNSEEDPVADLLDWLTLPDRYLFGYFQGGSCLGYIRLQRSGDSLFSSHPSMMSVTGLFVAPEVRRQSIGVTLLDAAETFLAERGCARTGVDYESLNPAGSRFWERHFVAYSLSLARRVDERVLVAPDTGTDA